MIKELDTSKAKELLGRNYIGHMSYIYNNNPYVVPITFFYDKEAENLISYAAEGQKIDAMRENPSVSLQVGEIDSLNEWKSVIAYGRFEELSGSTAQFELHKFCLGVKKLVKEKEQKDLKFLCDFSSKASSEKPPVVYRIHIEEMTARFRS